MERGETNQPAAYPPLPGHAGVAANALLTFSKKRTRRAAPLLKVLWKLGRPRTTHQMSTLARLVTWALSPVATRW
jgi:hypothetical protein